MRIAILGAGNVGGALGRAAGPHTDIRSSTGAVAG
jgi:predicted dinucleotide-binding enzyme